MRDSAIRHVVVSDEGSLVAAALFESTVQIWNWHKAQQIGEFATVLEFGGQRLALAAAGSICIAGSWTQGVAAYSVPDGHCIWRRPELLEVQLLTTTASGQEINCGLERRPLVVLDARTGNIIRTVKGASRIISSRFGTYEFIEERHNYRIAGKYTLEIPSMSFGLHDASFSPQSLCISEPNAGIRCVELESGRQVWHHPELSADHVAYALADFSFYCVARKRNPPNDCSLVRLAPKLMDCDQVAFIGPCWGESFSPSGDVLVTMRGGVYETSTGRFLRQLDFPQCDYPDK